MKIDTNNLYVACPIYNIQSEAEYLDLKKRKNVKESFLANHTIVIDPKKALILKSNNSHDTRGEYFNLMKEPYEPIFLYDCSSSYQSKKIWSNFALSISSVLGQATDELIKYRAERLKRKGAYVFTCLIPFKEYVKQRLNLDIGDAIYRSEALILLKALNIGCGKPFILSYNENEAKEQIQKKVYKKRMSR